MCKVLRQCYRWKCVFQEKCVGNIRAREDFDESQKNRKVVICQQNMFHPSMVLKVVVIKYGHKVSNVHGCA